MRLVKKVLVVVLSGLTGGLVSFALCNRQETVGVPGEASLRDIGQGSFFFGKGVFNACKSAKLQIARKDLSFERVDIVDPELVKELVDMLAIEVLPQLNKVPVHPNYRSGVYRLVISLYRSERPGSSPDERDLARIVAEARGPDFLLSIPISPSTTGKTWRQVDELIDRILKRFKQ